MALVNRLWMMQLTIESDAVTSPGLFGSFPWVDNKKKLCGFLFVFNLKKQKGRQRKVMMELKNIVDNEIDSY